MTSQQKQRELSLKNYYSDPSICLNCGKVIPVPENGRACDIKKRKFCNQSCAASYNNKVPKKKAIKQGHCIVCNVIIFFKKTSNGYYSPRSYCDKCLRVVRSRNSLNSRKSNRKELIENMTKEEVFKVYKNWQSARNIIRKDAQRVYKEAGLGSVCEICGYDLYTNICHIKDVSSFPGDTKVSEINKISNLVRLCPNHHKELDMKHIQIDIRKLRKNGLPKNIRC